MTFPKDVFHFVAHIPGYINHFRHHKTELGHIGLSEFITEHSGNTNHHDHDADNEEKSHLFSYFICAADCFIFPLNQNITNTFAKQRLSFVAVLPYNFSFNDFLIPHLLDKPPSEQIIYISPHSLPSGMRGSPATFI